MYYIGVDLGGTNIAAGIVDGDNGKMVVKGSVPTLAERDGEEIVKDMAALCEKLVADANLTKADIASVGIAAPGSADCEGGIIIYANNLRFKDFHIADIFRKYYGDVKVYVENDANAAAMGEAAYGASKGCNDSVMITLGTGLGGGVVANGKLVVGFNYSGAELGHTVIEADGLQCSCGRRGCWEAYSSATGLINMTKRKLDKTAKDATKMWEMVEKEGKVSGRTAFDAMRLGDAAGKEVVDEYIKYLAVGISNMINIFQPEVFVIGGGVCNEKDYLVKPLIDIVMKEQYYKGEKKTQIKVAELGNDAGIIGAAMLGAK